MSEYASELRNRVYKRRFDWDEALLLHQAGWTITALAEKYGVTRNAVRLATDPRGRSQQRAYQAERAASGTCGTCGGPCNGNRKIMRCVTCAAEAKVRRFKVDERGRHVAHCARCDEWKPWGEFATDESFRNGLRLRCRVCETTARRLRRHANRLPCVWCGTPASPDSRYPDKPSECRECYYEHRVRVGGRLVSGARYLQEQQAA
jgi:hypothetical protein